MADPMACRDCRGWWADNREEVLTRIKFDMALDEAIGGALDRLGLHGLHRRFERQRVGHGELVAAVVAAYHLSGHAVPNQPNEDNDDN